MQNKQSDGMWLRYLYCYSAWITLSVVGFFLIFLIRESLLAMTIALRLNPWAPRAVDNWSIYIMGMIWIFGVFALEGHLKNRMKKSRLWPTFARILLYLGIVGALAFSLILLF